MYDEDSDVIEFIQEEIICTEEIEFELNKDTIADLTSEDMELIMDDKEYGKA